MGQITLLLTMIIDAHTHLGSGNLLTANIKNLILSMKKAGIDKAIVFAGEINHCSTEDLLNETKNYPNIIYPVGSISPRSKSKPSLKQVEQWLKETQIYGLKFYPGYEPFFPFDQILRPYLKLLVKYGRPAIFHSGDTYNLAPNAKLKFTHPLHIDELAVEMPDLKIVIAHMGNPWIIDAAEVCYKNKNVFADFSGLVYGKFQSGDIKLAKRFYSEFTTFTLGEKKLIFGTDWPIAGQKDYVTRAKQIIGKKEAVFYKNAGKVFGLNDSK